MTRVSNKIQDDSKNVSRETSPLLTDYVALLLKWNAKINLIGPATEKDIWSRHIEDSLQLVSSIPSTASSLVDLGSGGGLPGLIIAIACPHLSVTLVEQDQRKAAFLKEAKRLLGLSNVTIEAVDIATLKGHYDVITARALASLTQLLAYSHTLLQAEGTAIFPKGANYATELTEAKANWSFREVQKPSVTNPNAAILILTQIQQISS